MTSTLETRSPESAAQDSALSTQHSALARWAAYLVVFVSSACTLILEIVAGRILATYMHGPALARNPALADLLLSWVVGDLAPLDDAEVEDLRTERFVAVRRRGRRLLRRD